MKQPKSFLFDNQDGIGTITLNRPERLNAITFAVYHELTDFIAQLADKEDVRVVVITGAGRAFCSGGDVRDIIGDLQTLDINGHLEFMRMTCTLIRNMRRLPQPIIASLNGTVAGAGACIALASDLRVASEAARIAFLFVKVGLSGADMGACFLRPRLVGPAKSTELFTPGVFITAKEAERIGLYNRVVAADELEAATQELAAKLARGPRFALALTKELLNRELDVSLDTALEWEAQAQALCLQHPDFRAAYEAFTAKREPEFKQ